MQQGPRPQPQRTVRERGLTLHWQKIGGRLGLRLHLQCVTVRAGNPSRNGANLLDRGALLLEDAEDHAFTLFPGFAIRIRG